MNAPEYEPDPAEVEELAALIVSDLYVYGQVLGLRPAESDRCAARTALRYMRDKREAGRV